MYYAHPSSGECFFLCLLLTAVKGATSFEYLRTVDNVVYGSFKEACFARGLLEDDREWIQCLEEASAMQTGSQPRSLFITILIGGNPTKPEDLWDCFRVHICDDLKYRLQHRGIPDPSDEQVYDYGLYLMEKLLKAQGSSLDKFPPMPVSLMGWTVLLGNYLLMEQKDYNQDQQQQMADQCIPNLNPDQHSAFDQIMHAVDTHSG
jgi:hypothetical protein